MSLISLVCDLCFTAQNNASEATSLCVLAAVIEAVIANQLTTAAIADPNIANQIITPRKGLNELNRVRIHHLTAGDQQITSRPDPLQTAILAALHVNPRTWTT